MVKEDEETRLHKTTPEGAAVLAALERIEALRDVVEFMANQVTRMVAGDGMKELQARVEEMRAKFRRTKQSYAFKPDPDGTPK